MKTTKASDAYGKADRKALEALARSVRRIIRSNPKPEKDGLEPSEVATRRDLVKYDTIELLFNAFEKEETS